MLRYDHEIRLEDVIRVLTFQTYRRVSPPVYTVWEEAETCMLCAKQLELEGIAIALHLG